MSDNKPQDPWIKGLGLFSAIIADLMGCTAIGVGLGYLAYAKWKAPIWVLFLTSVAGMILGFYRVIRLSQRNM